MILSISPNPALDRTLVLPSLEVGAVQRSQQKLVAAGGKGINVARAARLLGSSVLCAGPVGGRDGDLLTALVQEEGLAAQWTSIKEETRTCLILVSPGGQATVINEQGPLMDAASWQHLHADVLVASQVARYICFCGSLPPGVGHDQIRELLLALRDTGKKFWVDSSGPALRAAAELGGIALKINQHEAAALMDDSSSAPEMLAQAIHTRTAAPVILTLGARGVLYYTGAEMLVAEPPSIEIVSPVGSGDSALAGWLAALEQDQSIPEALRWAAAAGTANALSIGGARFSHEEFQRILVVTRIRTL